MRGEKDTGNRIFPLYPTPPTLDPNADRGLNLPFDYAFDE